ncbi:MAG: DUF975 family protein [Lachnospiraceae bacterium]|nr:DUF975 family protein [Lachnospiraceae bacterium]
MFNRADLKQKGMSAFKANYWPSIGAAFFALVAAGGSAGFNSLGRNGGSGSNNSGNAFNDFNNSLSNNTGLSNEQTTAIVAGVALVVIILSIVGIALKIFVFNPLDVGCKKFFNDNHDAPAQFGTIGWGFKNDYMRNVGGIFLRDLYIGLWSLLFVIPGIVKTYSYRMTPYILADRPELSANEAITESRRMMDGHKWDMFVLDLSFLGWQILSALTLGILGIFHVNPYVFSTEAAVYRMLSGREMAGMNNNFGYNGGNNYGYGAPNGMNNGMYNNGMNNGMNNAGYDPNAGYTDPNAMNSGYGMNNAGYTDPNAGYNPNAGYTDPNAMNNAGYNNGTMDSGYFNDANSGAANDPFANQGGAQDGFNSMNENNNGSDNGI